MEKFDGQKWGKPTQLTTSCGQYFTHLGEFSTDPFIQDITGLLEGKESKKDK
jgi:hypothetical protein